MKARADTTSVVQSGDLWVVKDGNRVIGVFGNRAGAGPFLKWYHETWLPRLEAEKARGSETDGE